MAARNKLKVIWNDEKWQVVKDGKVLNGYSSKEKAEQYARRIARRMISSQVLIYRSNGSIQKSFFFVSPPRQGMRLPV